MIVFRVRPAQQEAPLQSPSPTLPKGRELILAVFKAFSQDSFPLGKAGMGLLWWTERIPGNSVGVAIPQPRVAGEARYPG